MNRYQPYDRSSRERYQNQSSRQNEQFSDGDRNYGDDDRSSYGQMGESGSRGSYGEQDSDGYGARSSGWSGDRNRGGYDRGRDDRQGGSYSEQGGSYSSGGYGSSRYTSDDGRGFGSFTSNDFGGRDFSGQSRNYGAGRNSSGSYGGYGDAGYGSGSYGAAGSGRSSGGYGSSDRDRNERGFFERAGDEVASWFGDDDAARRREQDHRGRGPANYTRSDERILEDACDRLTEDWGVNATSIQVTVQNGEVTLDGTVPSRQQKRRAEDCVDDLSGVKHVQNNLRVQQSSDAGTNRSSSNQTSYDRTDGSSGTLA